MPIHAYRLVYYDSPQASEMFWEWEGPCIQVLIENARTLHHEVVLRYFLTWDDLAQENQRIWETYYLPRTLYQLSKTWRAWRDAYRDIVRDVHDMLGEHSGRRSEDQLRARENGLQG